MNDCFSFRRFGKYLTYDLSNAWNNYGLSLIVSCCTPILFYVVFQIFHLALGHGWGEYHIGFQCSAYITAYVIVNFFAPTKIYGHVTDKRAGTDWLMRPASALEKTLSMVLVTCIAIPVVGCAVLFASDAILGLVVPGYGHFLLASCNMADFNEAFDMIGIRPTASVIYIGFCSSILFFTLGAIVFKKSKVAKTILASFALSIVLSAIFASFMGTLHISGEQMADFFERFGADGLQRRMNLWFNVYYFVFMALVYLGIYFRVKTIKH